MQLHRLCLLGVLLALPLFASAQQPNCKHWQPRVLPLDLAGVKRIVFEIGRHDLHLTAAGTGEAGYLEGRACASNEDYLSTLQLTQEKRGEQLTVRLQNQNSPRSLNLFGDNYAYLQINGVIPDSIDVGLNVGSGDAKLVGAASVTATVGSGDAAILNTRGAVLATLGSGDLDIAVANSVDLSTVGSGDAEIKRIHGNVKIGSVGSGDVNIEDVQGQVDVGAIGSGDVEIENITGNINVGTLGSGSLKAENIRGDLRVRTQSSGDIEHRAVTGAVDIPRR